MSTPPARFPAPTSARPDSGPAYDGSRLALIVGHYKSGSSWLDNVLSVHPDVRGLQETHVFRYALKNSISGAVEKLFTISSWAEGGWRNLPRQRAGQAWHFVRSLSRPARHQAERPNTCLDLSLLSQWRLRRHLAASPSPKEFCRRFFAFLDAELRPARYLVEKTPNNTQFVPFIRTVFPKAKLIAIYRDGRDVCVSAKFFQVHRAQKDPTSSATSVRRGFEETIRNWRQQIAHQLEYARTHDLHTLSYKALLADGPAVPTALLAFLDLPRDSAIVAEMLRKASVEVMTGRQSGQESLSSFYRKGGAGDWEEPLHRGRQTDLQRHRRRPACHPRVRARQLVVSAGLAPRAERPCSNRC